jgi:hypothetical protein
MPAMSGPFQRTISTLSMLEHWRVVSLTGRSSWPYAIGMLRRGFLSGIIFFLHLISQTSETWRQD